MAKKTGKSQGGSRPQPKASAGKKSSGTGSKGGSSAKGSAKRSGGGGELEQEEVVWGKVDG